MTPLDEEGRSGEGKWGGKSNNKIKKFFGEKGLSIFNFFEKF